MIKGLIAVLVAFAVFTVIDTIQAWIDRRRGK
jgi:Flp pilus assembly pilin Flp